MTERLKKHKDIYKYQKEFEFNRQKSMQIGDEIISVKKKLTTSTKVLGLDIKNPEKEKPTQNEVKKEIPMSPRLKRIEEEKQTTMLIQRNMDISIKKVGEGETLLENQFYCLEDCILELSL